VARSDFLERFRPLGAPGAATVAPGRAVDTLGPEAELAPVFAALADQVAACDALGARATADAEQAIAAARTQASATVARARMDVGAEQARAAEAVRREAGRADADLLRAADAQAAAVRRDTDDVTATVQAVIGQLLAELAP